MANTKEKNETPAQVMVEPLSKDALRVTLQIIDNADVKGSDAGNIVLLKQELARVANDSRSEGPAEGCGEHLQAAKERME